MQGLCEGDARQCKVTAGRRRITLREWGGVGAAMCWLVVLQEFRGQMCKKVLCVCVPASIKARCQLTGWGELAVLLAARSPATAENAPESP